MYTVQVTEVRHFEVLYTVEAKSTAEAELKACQGDTVKEEEVKNHGVLDRFVDEQPVLEGSD